MTKRKQKVLIIKVGYSETLASDLNTIKHVTSYGDVLRSTVLLNLFRDDHVTWLVDEKAYPILKGNPMIDRILIYNLTSTLQLQAEHFDTVINLEKIPGICALADAIKAWRRFGFRFDPQTGEADAYDGSHLVLEFCKDIEKKKNRTAYWQEGLFEMVGAEWNGEEYVFGYKPKSEISYDIGFNHQVGNKWPLKGWPMEHWKKLEGLINGDYSISWQQGLDNIEDYFEWINSCRMLVTNDSFGMHIAIALKKPMVTLFGPTDKNENFLYGLGRRLVGEKTACDMRPCGAQVEDCPKFRHSCTEVISPEEVCEHVKLILNNSSKEKMKV